MAIPDTLKPGLRLPAIASPMFLISGPDLVVETCKAGILGTFPSLNQRSGEGYRDWLSEISERLSHAPDAAPFGINLVVHGSNSRLDTDLAATVEHSVPLVITSLGAVEEVVDAIHAYGGLVFHDVVNRRHAEKAANAGVDGLIAVSAGAGGHGGTINPFAFVSELRSFFDGTIVLAGSISTGAHIAAARAMGADLAYLGTRFIATRESLAPDGYKRMIVDSRVSDILYTPSISGVPANFMRQSILANGFDPENLPEAGKLDMEGEARAWRDFWSAGHGVSAIADIPSAASLCARLEAEYREALMTLQSFQT